MNQHNKLSLKAFWDTIEQRLAACSADELRNILRQLAQETKPNQRQAFLAKLRPRAAADVIAEQLIQQEDLLADIDDELAQLQTAMENPDHEYWDYDDEDSLGPYADYVDSLSELFDRVEAAFDSGKLGLARQAYRKLFAAFNLEDDYGRGVHVQDLTEVDSAEARARYLRSVYETEPLENRAPVLFAAMQETAAWERPLPMFADLIQISPRPLPDQEPFLGRWIALLRQRQERHADTWLREAIRLSEGAAGLAKLAQTEGKQRPRVYLDWLAALEQQGEHRQALEAAHQALEALPAELPIRAAIADHLCTAAAALNQPQQVQEGRWQAFLVKPDVQRLIQLWDAFSNLAERTRRMQRAAEHLEETLKTQVRSSFDWELDELEQPVWVEKSTLAHALLLSKQWEAAYQLAAAAEVLGWSSRSSHQSLVVAFLLMALAHKTPATLPANLQQCWHLAITHSVGYMWSGSASGTGLIAVLDRSYEERLSDTALTERQHEQFLSGCLDIAQRRIASIVSQQHRRSYDKAAVLACACAEVLKCSDAQRAQRWLENIRAAYPRHRAFQTELQAASRGLR
jgi:hypothetical protein